MGLSMQEYEIRVLRPEGGATLITAAVQFNDDAAITFARKLASGRKFEVWKDDKRIYGPIAADPASEKNARPEP